jgi:hypothetical protein
VDEPGVSTDQKHPRPSARRAVDTSGAPGHSGSLSVPRGGFHHRRRFPQRGLIDVRFAPKATEVLRCRKASLCAQFQT